MVSIDSKPRSPPRDHDVVHVGDNVHGGHGSKRLIDQEHHLHSARRHHSLRYDGAWPNRGDVWQDELDVFDAKLYEINNVVPNIFFYSVYITYLLV